MKPSISVVIPAYNEAKYIAETYKSVFITATAYYEGHVEIIVVDNNSTDKTGEIASSLGAIVVFEEKNQIARARNAGAKKATGDYLVFVDADTLLIGDILDKVSTHLSSGKVIGGGAWTEPDSKGVGYYLFKYGINYLLAIKNITVGPFLYCNREAFFRVGGFDESYYAGEEFTLARRLKKEGKKENKSWKIIRYHSGHRIITSSRRFGRFGGLEMAFKNIHLLWQMDRKLKQKSQCKFWYDNRE
ncbi:MAG: glycosyltransferase [Gammaproteobacteria bacterium]|nr:glycosyltransferase [Gammaproteobacteria bacterium]